jgi:hypothetical protein
MFVITVLMFSSVKNAVAIWLTVPLALIGVTPGFLLTGIPFGFMALIGLLSLSGMLIRNGIVLVEEIEQQNAKGSARGDRVRRHLAPAPYPAHRVHDRTWPGSAAAGRFLPEHGRCDYVWTGVCYNPDAAGTPRDLCVFPS